jgi:Fe-S-cluster containining protein
MSEPLKPAVVACNGCTICCRSGELILIMEEDGDYPYDTREIVVGERSFTALAVKEDGSCVYVTSDGCAIHRNAPLTCQVFDCGAFYASKTRHQRRAFVSQAGRSVEGRAYVKALLARGREMHRLKIGSAAWT